MLCVIQSNMSSAQIYVYICVCVCVCVYVCVSSCLVAVINVLTAVARHMQYSIRGHFEQRYENLYLYSLSLVVLGTSKLHKKN
jgi:heme O synthase-like polyprenyltransferase